MGTFWRTHKPFVLALLKDKEFRASLVELIFYLLNLYNQVEAFLN